MSREESIVCEEPKAQQSYMQLWLRREQEWLKVEVLPWMAEGAYASAG